MEVDGEMDADGETLRLALLLGDWLALGLTEADSLDEGEIEALGLRLRLTDELGDSDGDGETLGDSLALGEREADGLTEGEAELDGDTEALGESDGDSLDEGDAEAEGERLGLTLALGLMLADGDKLALGLSPGSLERKLLKCQPMVAEEGSAAFPIRTPACPRAVRSPSVTSSSSEPLT